MKIKKYFVWFLLAGLIVGIALGIVLGERAIVLKPFGDLFINLLFVILVPLLFCSVVLAIAKMSGTKTLLKIVLPLILVTIITSIISALIGYVGGTIVNFIDGVDFSEFTGLTDDMEATGVNIIDSLIKLISVSDFNDLLSKNNIIALLVFAIIFAFAVRMSKEKGIKVLEFIESLNNVISNFLSIIMFYAPIGIGCYFAALIGTLGQSLLGAFAKVLLSYTVTCIVLFFSANTLHVFIAGGKSGIIKWYKHIWMPELMALSTCSSAACMPICFEYAEKMGADPAVSNLVIPIGTNFHKDGAIVGSVFKILFVSQLLATPVNFFLVIIISILAALLVGAVPTGAASVSEVFILSILGFPLEVLPLLIGIATIIDSISTAISVGGNMSSTLLVSKFATRHLKKSKVIDNENN